MKYYNGNESGQTPGLLPASGQWSWWEAGALLGQVHGTYSRARHELTSIRWSSIGSYQFAPKHPFTPLLTNIQGITPETTHTTTSPPKAYSSKPAPTATSNLRTKRVSKATTTKHSGPSPQCPQQSSASRTRHRVNSNGSNSRKQSSTAKPDAGTPRTVAAAYAGSSTP